MEVEDILVTIVREEFAAADGFVDDDGNTKQICFRGENITLLGIVPSLSDMVSALSNVRMMEVVSLLPRFVHGTGGGQGLRAAVSFFLIVAIFRIELVYYWCAWCFAELPKWIFVFCIICGYSIGYSYKVSIFFVFVLVFF